MMEMAYIKEVGDDYWVVTETDYFDRGYAAHSFTGTFDECVEWCDRNNCRIVSGATEFFE